jgi:hypothetical protein
VSLIIANIKDAIQGSNDFLDGRSVSPSKISSQKENLKPERKDNAPDSWTTEEGGRLRPVGIRNGTRSSLREPFTPAYSSRPNVRNATERGRTVVSTGEESSPRHALIDSHATDDSPSKLNRSEYFDILTAHKKSTTVSLLFLTKGIEVCYDVILPFFATRHYAITKPTNS